MTSNSTGGEGGGGSWAGLGWSARATVLEHFSAGVRLMWMIGGQEPIVLPIGAGVSIFSLSPTISDSFLPLCVDGSIKTEILSQRAVKNPNK